jgi:predicted nucleotidyltransferase component of viral defense system
MSRSDVSNIVQSVSARLKNKAEESGFSYQQFLFRYGMERFLYRLSRSAYARQLILKGGLMQFVWAIPVTRPTMDMDFLGKMSNDSESILKVITDICGQKVETEDGISFDLDKAKSKRTTEDAGYHGIRVKFVAYLGRQCIPMQIDIGFSDQVTPEPSTVRYPTLLNDDTIVIEGYTVESVIAEKFQAMIKLDEANSRMKDFFDIWWLLRSVDIDGGNLFRAARITFEKRATNMPDAPFALSEEFARIKQTQWSAFLRKSEISEVALLEFSDVIARIREFLMPIVESWASDTFEKGWSAGQGWIDKD